MRRLLAVSSVAAVIGGFGVPAAMATRPPTETGEPGTATPAGAECGKEGSTVMPKGLETEGFEHAGSVYAGSEGTPSAENGASNAVSEYDIACFQQTQKP